jgi:hypothetical protein
MENVKIEVTLQELLLVTSLMSDQLFRREFIDPKMPGYKTDPAELALGKQLVLRLKSVVQQVAGPVEHSASKHAPSHLSPATNGIPDAV